MDALAGAWRNGDFFHKVGKLSRLALKRKTDRDIANWYGARIENAGSDDNGLLGPDQRLGGLDAFHSQVCHNCFTDLHDFHVDAGGHSFKGLAAQARPLKIAKQIDIALPAF